MADSSFDKFAVNDISSGDISSHTVSMGGSANLYYYKVGKLYFGITMSDTTDGNLIHDVLTTNKVLSTIGITASVVYNFPTNTSTLYGPGYYTWNGASFSFTNPANAPALVLCAILST